MNRMNQYFRLYIDEQNAFVVGTACELTRVTTHAFAFEFAGAIDERCAAKRFNR